ncbi:PilZ domain-containing protein [Spartinivicinus ruber]|uniref:PilZ domain-containing protein n=1 Tax=Spartinivicinus ruber TaxID=2683272 RepID=UPI0013D8D86C|nr:PilZ domain-containing protein [Spartinivicinus ruber]
MDSILFTGTHRAPRKTTKWHAALKVKGNIIAVKILNISAQGALINSNYNLIKNELIALMINAKYDKNRLIIYTRALVRHSTIRKNNFYLGLQFIEIARPHQQFITNYIDYNEAGF